jgi:hypothetical protein
VTVACGFAVVAAGLLLLLMVAQMKARRFFERPTLARNRLFDPLLTLLAYALIPGGFALAARGSRRAAAAGGTALALLWGYHRFIRSVRFQGWLLKRDYGALRRRHAGRPEKEILFELVSRRNPRWGDELIEQMVVDYPTIEELSRMIAKMERGFRGFR